MKYLTDDGEVLDENCEECGTIFFKTPHNHDTLKEAMKGALICTDPSLTDQSFIADADINNLMEKIRKGHIPDITLPEHFGADNRIDLLEARTRIAESNATFYNLDAKVRSDFNNDPARWEQAVYNALQTGNAAKLREMGIDIQDPPAPTPEGIQPGTGNGGTGGQPPPEPPKPSDPPKKGRVPQHTYNKERVC